MQQNIDAKSDFEAQKFTLKHAHLTSFLRNRNETAEVNPRSKIQEDLPGRFGGPGLRCQAISFVLIVQSAELA
jgi:hypothetical protein